MEAELAAGKDPASALERIQRCSKLASEGLAEARNAVSALRRDVPTLPEAIAELADDHQRDHGATATLRGAGTERPIPSAATVSLLGAVREALTNAARHAPGAPITITIDYTDTAVRVVVRNESTDPRPRDEGTGFGLTGMAERVALAGGSLTAGPDGDGWSVIATMPLQHVDHPAQGGGGHMNGEPIRVLVVDDQQLVREKRLTALLELTEDVEVVGQAAHGREALDILTRKPCDVVLMDLRMPVLDGVAATREIRNRHPEVAVLVLTTYSRRLDPRRSRGRRTGYLTKEPVARRSTRRCGRR